MISLSHWGMFPWFSDDIDSFGTRIEKLDGGRSFMAIHPIYQRLNFGELS